MKRSAISLLAILSLTLLASVAHGVSADVDPDKHLSGMSIVGNDEAPKSLVIVPWKSSELGDTLGLSRALEDGRQPVDREVFGRALDYYRIRTGWGNGRGTTAQ
jgi:hypothetical protein